MPSPQILEFNWQVYYITWLMLSKEENLHIQKYVFQCINQIYDMLNITCKIWSKNLKKIYPGPVYFLI